MKKDEAKEKIERQYSCLEALRGMETSSEKFKKWRRNTEIAIEKVFGSDSRHLNDFTSIRWAPRMLDMANPKPAYAHAFHRGLEASKAILGSMQDEIEEYWDSEAGQIELNALAIVEKICARFHLVARQLRARRSNRNTLDIEDEYDVQDLLHALLKIDFDDVRPEEWTPSYAGKSARVDFLLKSESIVIEVKKTRAGLGAKELGDQLIIDVARYKVHPDCGQLICFVYDPEGRIGNPASIEADLNGTHDGLEVKVIISPKGL